ncbi:MAG: cytochrome c oxidase subunit II [Gammaproteobacteria bacterium]
MSDLVAWLPAAASAHARSVDQVFLALLAVSVLTVVVVTAALGVLALRYRAGARAPRDPRVLRSPRLEAAWSLLTLVVFVALCAWSTRVYLATLEPPADTLDIAVTAAQWRWRFEHPGGIVERGELHVPVGRPVRLVLDARDVIHSFYVPALRLKQDAVPGRYTSTWFELDTAGEYPVRCAEFCGTGHATMRATLVALAADDFAAWHEQAAAGASGETPAQRGGALFESLGCASCHAADSATPAPDLHGVAGREVTLADGSTLRADAEYIRESILAPRARVVAGYDPIMPSFEGQLEDAELRALVAYVESLAEASP